MESKLAISEEELAVLDSLIRSPQTPQGQVVRLRIVRLAFEGRRDSEIVATLGVSLSSAGKWRRRFAARGLAGLRDLPRSGKPRTHGREELRARIFAQLEKDPPPGQAVWDGPSLAAVLKVNVHAIWRLLRHEGICLQRQRSWCVSTDPEFAAKAAEIVGLYLNTPVNALVISVDEKPGIQALTRPSGYVLTSNAKVVRGLKSTYKRNGTLTLFAALKVAAGEVIAATSETKKRADFQAFMTGVIAGLPQDKEIHVILDNLSTHKKNEAWLARYEGRVIFHFTPTSASWLNLVEVWFGLLTRKTLRGASFPTKVALREAIEAFVKSTNDAPRPFVWRKREVRGAQLRNTIANLRN